MIIQHKKIKDTTKKSYKLIGEFFERGELRNAVTHIFDYVALANKYYDNKQPWIQVKEDINAFNDTTYTCAYIIANMANMIAPVLPNASLKIKSMLNLPDYKWEETKIKGNYKVQDLQILYDRIEEKKHQLMKKKVVISLDNMNQRSLICVVFL